jgi:hypothetical protein
VGIVEQGALPRFEKALQELKKPFTIGKNEGKKRVKQTGRHDPGDRAPCPDG